MVTEYNNSFSCGFDHHLFNIGKLSEIQMNNLLLSLANTTNLSYKT